MSSQRFYRLWQLLLGASIGCLPIAAAVASDPGLTEKATKQTAQRATELVAKALRAEADGELIQRDQLLSEASSVAQDLPQVNWFRGKLQDSKGNWLSIDESVDKANDQSVLDEYEKQRSRLSDTVQGHWQMAIWCAQRRLAEQCRAHLNAIIKLDPDHSNARRVLGFQLVEGEWISPEKIVELTEQTQLAQQSLEKYGLKVKQLLSKDSNYESVTRSLAEIKDPLAIPAMELAASGMGDTAAKLVVEWLGKIDAPEASQSLTRFALNYPSDAIRELAAEQLRGKPIYDYMPELLAGLSGPIQATLVPATDRRGNLVGYRQAFAKEGMNENRVMLVDRGLTMRGRPELRARDSMNQLIQNMAQGQLATDAAVRGNRVEAENTDIRSRNKQIVSLISDVTGKEFANVPVDVWTWWDEYNETNYQDYKPARYRRDAMTFEVPEYSGGISPTGRSSGGRAGECFVAGTLISTQRGMRAVEQVEVGDMALSRNASTGELCWKPVIARTTRPPEPTLKLSVDDSQLQCTTGHLLWVSGKGWTKASQIKEGDLLHTAADPAVVSKVSKAEVAPTFNLEIAENHTYFVGSSRVLSHDVTPRGASRDLVPGQLQISKR